jgi:hypothetical protein
MNDHILLNHEEMFMKKIMPVVALLLVSIASVQGAPAAADVSLEKRMDNCFRAHAHLMEKPGLHNRMACWRAHSSLM